MYSFMAQFLVEVSMLKVSEFSRAYIWITVLRYDPDSPEYWPLLTWFSFTSRVKTANETVECPTSIGVI